MGKVEIGIYFCVTVGILTKVLQKCSWSRYCNGNIKFPKIYNGNSESRTLFLSDYRYFDKSFTVMFLEHLNLVKTAEFN